MTTGGPPARFQTSWHILTGEYPPRPGGVADYTALVAAGLADAGDEVHVWTTAADGPAPETPGVAVHRRDGGWGRGDLRRLGAALDDHPAPRRLLVQYTPVVWGRKGLNRGLTRWLVGRRRRGDAIWAMVHEVAYPFWLRDRPWRWLLAATHQLMIRDVLAAADRAFVTNLNFVAQLRRYDPRPGRSATWLPVPSNVPVVDDPSGVADVRRRLAAEAQVLIGTFGTYGSQVVGTLLDDALPALLAGRADRSAVLLGRGGDRRASALEARHPGLRGRLSAPGGLPAEVLSRYLQACDLLLMPFNDGVSARRTTAMAALAHGRPLVSTTGHNTEPLWAESGAVALAPAGAPAALTALAEALLADPARRSTLGASARALYESRFAVAHTVAALRSEDARTIGIEAHEGRAYTGTSQDRGPRRANP